MKSNLSKREIEDLIIEAFNKENLSSNEIKKIKKLAMSKNIKLTEYRKKFCKKCNSFYNSNNSETRIKKPFKIIKCKACGNVSRYKLK
jgi:RNase P subunit RPR2